MRKRLWAIIALLALVAGLVVVGNPVPAGATHDDEEDHGVTEWYDFAAQKLFSYNTCDSTFGAGVSDSNVLKSVWSDLNLRMDLWLFSYDVNIGAWIQRQSVSTFNVDGVTDRIVAGDFSGTLDSDGGGCDYFLARPGPDAELCRQQNGFVNWQVAGPCPAVNGSYEDILVGDFNGDNQDDIFYYAPGSAPDYLARGSNDHGGEEFEFDSFLSPVSGVYEPEVCDFDADGRDDIYWRGQGTAPDYLWYGRSSGALWDTGLVAPQAVNGVYHHSLCANLNHPVTGGTDAKSDLIVCVYHVTHNCNALLASSQRFVFNAVALTIPGNGPTIDGEWTPGLRFRNVTSTP